jgi:hypothetical protein
MAHQARQKVSHDAARGTIAVANGDQTGRFVSYGLVADHRAVKIIGVGAVDLHRGDLADTERTVA